MKIIKLDAIDSTNIFLKNLANTSILENYTTVTSEMQHNGKGQMNSSWHSESGKNLLFSIFTNHSDKSIVQQIDISFATAITIIEVLLPYHLPKLRIKWPNDILSLNSKICGILIENVIKGGQITHSIIGIGLNVNQVSFPTNLSNACSIKLLTNKEINRDVLLVKIIEQLKINLTKNSDYLKNKYLELLYKKNIPCMFKDNRTNFVFMGIIIGISALGKLQVQHENDAIVEYGIKEISFL